MTEVKKKQERREKTEAAILDAFERVLLREGAHNISLISVAREASVTKVLIYRYFDSLVGLIKAWAADRQNLPDFKSIFEDGDASDFSDTPIRYQKQGLLQLAEHLRRSPVTLELMMAELLESGPVSIALRELRLEQAQKDERDTGVKMLSSDAPGEATFSIFYAAICYLSLRSRKSPKYMESMHLDTDEGWNAVMGNLEKILDDLVAFQAYMAEGKDRRKG